MKKMKRILSITMVVMVSLAFIPTLAFAAPKDEHAHSWSYTLNDVEDTVTAVCNAESGEGPAKKCEFKDKSVNVEIVQADDYAAALEYYTIDGKGKEGKIDAKKVSDIGIPVSAIEYSWWNSGTHKYQPISDTPSMPGNYKASVTVGDKTAHIEYSISAWAPQSYMFDVKLPADEDLKENGEPKEAEVTVKSQYRYWIKSGDYAVEYYKDNDKNPMKGLPTKKGTYTFKVVINNDIYGNAVVSDSSWQFTITKEQQINAYIVNEVGETVDVTLPEDTYKDVEVRTKDFKKDLSATISGNILTVEVLNKLDESKIPAAGIEIHVQGSIKENHIHVYLHVKEKTHITINAVGQSFIKGTDGKGYIYYGVYPWGAIKESDLEATYYDKDKNPLGSKPTEVGDYFVKLSYKGSADYYPAETELLSFQIIAKAPEKVDIPKARLGLIYNGEEQIGVPTGVGYEIADNFAVNAGDYKATAKLSFANTTWSDGTTEDKIIDWSINQRRISVVADSHTGYVGDTAEALTYTADPLCGNDEFTGELEAADLDMASAGTYLISIGTLTAGDNYAIDYTPGAYFVLEKPDPSEAKTWFGVKGSVKKTSATLTWTPVSIAEGYDVYFGYCGKTIKNVKSTTALKYTVKKLNAKKTYKAYVEAYVVIDGQKVVIDKTSYIHLAGSKAKESNATKVTADKNEVTLAIGDSVKVTGKVAKKSSKKPVLWKNHVSSNIRYKSADETIAKVDSKGNITAVNPGKVYVYAYAASGVSAKVLVEVTGAAE